MDFAQLWQTCKHNEPVLTTSQNCKPPTLSAGNARSSLAHQECKFLKVVQPRGWPQNLNLYDVYAPPHLDSSHHDSWLISKFPSSSYCLHCLDERGHDPPRPQCFYALAIDLSSVALSCTTFSPCFFHTSCLTASRFVLDCLVSCIVGLVWYSLGFVLLICAIVSGCVPSLALCPKPSLTD
jgi:hypothetical protein